jgi:hypothetical protein
MLFPSIVSRLFATVVGHPCRATLLEFLKTVKHAPSPVIPVGQPDIPANLFSSTLTPDQIEVQNRMIHVYDAAQLKDYCENNLKYITDAAQRNARGENVG